MNHQELMAELHKRGFYTALQEYVNDLSSNESFEVWEDLVKEGAAVVHFHLNEYGKLIAIRVLHEEEKKPVEDVTITAPKKKPK